MRPRARIIVVDGTSWPAAASRILQGSAHPVGASAESPRLVQSAALELLVEDAPVTDSRFVARARGVDALVIVEGRSLSLRIDALAITSALSTDSARPLLFVVCAPERESDVREVLLASRLDADEARMLAPGVDDAATTSALLEMIDAALSRAPSARLRVVADGTTLHVVSGEAPIAARAWTLADDGWWPDDIVLPSAARAGDVVAIQRPRWRAIDGTVDAGSTQTAESSASSPCECIAGRVVLEGNGPPAGAEVVVFTDGGESPGVIDDLGALVMRRALPLPPGGSLGVFVVRAPMRPSTPGALGARVLACVPHPDRARIRRRPSQASDVEPLFQLHMQTMRPAVEATWGPWDEADQRARFVQNPLVGRYQLVVDGADIIASYRVVRHLHEIMLASIEVAPDHQSGGLGSAIVRELVAEAFRERARLTLSVLKKNPRALALYRSLGFVQMGESTTHVQLAAVPRPQP